MIQYNLRQMNRRWKYTWLHCRKEAPVGDTRVRSEPECHRIAGAEDGL